MTKKELKDRLEKTEMKLEKITREHQKLKKELEEFRTITDTVTMGRIKILGDRIGRIEVKLGDMIRTPHQEKYRRQGDQRPRNRKKHR